MADEKEKNEEQARPSLVIYVTGASTSFGRVLVRALVQDGHRVIGSTGEGTRGATVIRADGGLPVYPDLTRAGEIRSSLLMAKAHVVIHCQATPLNGVPQHRADYKAALATLTTATDNLMTAAGQAGVKRVVFLSCAFAYGDHGGDTVTEETALTWDNDLYAALARSESAVLDGGVPGVILRTGFIYGGHSEPLRQVMQAVHGGRAALPGRGLAGWVHEDDLVEAVRRVAIPSAEARETAQEKAAEAAAAAAAEAAEAADDDDDKGKGKGKGKGEGEVDEAAEAQSAYEAALDDLPLGVFNIVDDHPAAPDRFIDEFCQHYGIGKPPRVPDFLLPLRTSAIQRALLMDSARVVADKAKAELGWAPRYPDQASGIERTLLDWRAAEAPPEEEAETTDDNANTEDTEIVPA